jgi:hypothetical protein
MNDYMILVGLAAYARLGDEAENDKSGRLWAIYDSVFSLGPAWHGNQSAILLKSYLSREQIVERLSPLVGEADLVCVMEIAPNSMTTIGYIADEEGLDVIYPNAVKIGVSASGGTCPIS